MYQLGLIGKSLTHSFSKKYFDTKFKNEGIKGIQYDLFELEDINLIHQFLLNPYLKGFNVTIPYKESIIPFLDEIKEEAIAIGAINCVSLEHGKWIGHNTDWIGFTNAINPILNKNHQKALILGTGGAAKAVNYALHQLGIQSSYVSRNSNIGLLYEELNNSSIEEFQIIINCTPIGMYPNIQESPLSDYIKINKDAIVCDLIYNPIKTKLLEQADNKGAMILNGMPMLMNQAEESWQIWRGLCAY